MILIIFSVGHFLPVQEGQKSRSFIDLSSKLLPDSPSDKMTQSAAKRETKQRDWRVIWKTQRRGGEVESKRCVCGRTQWKKREETVVLNWDKLELLEGLLLPGWPLKEQLVLALTQWMEVEKWPALLAILADRTDQSGRGTCSSCGGRCVWMWTRARLEWLIVPFYTCR